MSLEPCFEFTYRWPQLAADLLSGDGQRVAAAVLRLEERDREIEQKVCQETSSLPESCCGQVYNGPVDSYSDATVTDATDWTSTYVLAHARIWVQNNTGGSGLVELDGYFTTDGVDQSGASASLLRLTLADGEGILLADHCTITRGATSNGYRVANVGSLDVDVNVNVTLLEVEAPQACCTGVD